MAKLDGYEGTLVVQRASTTGCIPSGIEWMARYMKVPDVKFDSFQEDFDLAAGKRGLNGFETVPREVAATYPLITTFPIGFLDVEEKLKSILDCITSGKPCLVSLWEGGGCFHIVPVVEASDASITVLWMDKATLGEQRRVIPHEETRRRHHAVPGGRDLLIWGKRPNEG